MSARNPLIVRADICGFSARSSAEKVKFSVSCTVCHLVEFTFVVEPVLAIMIFKTKWLIKCARNLTGP